MKVFSSKLPDEEEAIITDTSKVVNTLNSLCVEMDTIHLLKQAMARQLKNIITNSFNENWTRKGHKYMPYIVLVIDEFT